MEDNQREQKAEVSRNPTQGNQGQEHGSAVFIFGANFDERNTASEKNEPGTSNALGSTFKTAQGEHGERTSPAPAKENEEDGNEVFVLGKNVYYSNTAAAQNEPVSSNTLDSTFEKAEREQCERTRPTAAIENEVDENEVFVLEANVHYSNTAAAFNEPVSPNAVSSTLEKSDETHDERRNPR